MAKKGIKKYLDSGFTNLIYSKIIKIEKNIFPITTPIMTDVKVCGLALKAALFDTKNTTIVKTI